MLFGPDMLSNIFLGMFLFGLIFTIVSLALGHIGGMEGPHIGGNGGVDVGHDTSHSALGVLNMPTILAFITWFGGAGYLFRQALGVGVVGVLVLAFISGLVGGGVMFLLLSKVLWPMMTKPMERADYALPGTPARVVSPIRKGGVGEIVYTKAGSRFTSGARSADGSAIQRGAEVVILRYERGLAYVQDVNTLLDGLNTEREVQEEQAAQS